MSLEMKAKEPYIYMVYFNENTTLSRLKRFAIRFTNFPSMFPYLSQSDAEADVSKISKSYRIDPSELYVASFPLLTDVDRRYAWAPSAMQNEPSLPESYK